MNKEAGVLRAISGGDEAYIREHFDDVREIESRPLILSLWSIALIEKKIGVARVFLENGQDPNRRSSEGNPDLRFLVLHHKGPAFDEWIDMFISFGSTLDVRDGSGLTLLGFARTVKNEAAVRKLQALGLEK